MTCILPRNVGRQGRAVTALLAVFVASLLAGRAAGACETPPDLHIDVTSKFDLPVVRNGYTLAEIAALARQRYRDTGRPLLGFYASEFGYTIKLEPAGDPACPARIEATVTLRLQHRLIEIGQEAATDACMYALALRHYRQLAEVDEQTVERFGAHAAVMLAQAIPALKQLHPAHAEDLDAALREKIRDAVDKAIARLPGERRDAQQAVNRSDELGQLANSCSI